MKILAPKYYTEFKCIASDCEASCCDYPWRITVDKKKYNKIKNVYDNSKEDRAVFKKSIKRIKVKSDTTKNDMSYACIKQGEGGRCNLLDENKLCGLIKKVDHKILPHTCTVYPRLYNTIGKERVEAGMGLSCPEATRKCLLDRDSHILQEVTKEQIGSSFIVSQFSLNQDSINCYNAYVDVVKNLAMNILSDERYPLKSRLFFLALFGNKSKVFLYKGISEDVSIELGRLCKLIESGETKEILHNQLKEINIPSEIGMGILQQCVIIQPKIQDGISHLLTRLFKKTILNCIDLINDEQLINSNIDINREQMNVLWQFYLVRRDEVKSLYADLIDSRLTQYCIHFWMTNWYEQSENILLHTRNCLVYKAIISFLIYCHSDLNCLHYSEKKQSFDEACKLIDAVIVEVVFSFSRDTSNQDGMVQLLVKHLNNRQMVEFAPIMLLIDF